MAILHRAKMKRRTTAALNVLFVLSLCWGCSGREAMIAWNETRSERLRQLLTCETRLEQLAIARRSAPYRDPELEHFIGKILAVLMPSEAVHGRMPWVVLVKDAALNAYSFPDGAIYLYTGLLARLENEAELALLLAHELVHISRQHALKVLMANPEHGRSACARRGGPDSLSWSQDISAARGNTGPSEEELSLRQSLEMEADRLGLDMVIKANYDVQEALEIFEHLRENDITTAGMERIAALSQAAIPIVPTAARLTDRSVFGKHLQQLLCEHAGLELRNGRWDEALRCVHRLLRDAPNHARGHFLLGEILRQRNQTGDVPQALDHYFRAIASDPAYPAPHKAIGLIHLKRGEARLARGFFERALALAPHSHDNDYIRSYLTQCIIKIEGEHL
jgi:predicted Zn-dependent protease